MVPADNLTDALKAVRDGTVAGAAGNGLALRAAARDLGMEELAELPLRSVPYALATAKGRGPQFSWVGEALNRLHQAGQFNHLVEQHLVIAPGPRTWRDFAWPLGLGLAAVVAAGGATIVWNRVPAPPGPGPHARAGPVPGREGAPGRVAAAAGAAARGGAGHRAHRELGMAGGRGPA